MLEVMRFWLDKGVDGFRVDVMWHMIKDKHFRDNPPNPEYSEKQKPYRHLIPAYSTNQQGVHDVVRMMRKVTDEYENRVIVGEIYLPIKELVTYYGEDSQGAHLPFNFQLVVLPWDARKIEAAINEYEGSLPPEGWPNWVLGNHDQKRIMTRIGKEQASVAAILLLTLRGTPTMYYGDEIGMENVPISPELVQDPQEKNVPGIGVGRDPERTPMQWDNSKNAGFTTGSPWLPLMKNYKEVNVDKKWDDPKSILSLYRKLIALRNREPALKVGDYTPVYTEGDLLSYIRNYDEKQFLIALNLSDGKEELDIKRPDGDGVMRIARHPELEQKKIKGNIQLKAITGMLIKIMYINSTNESIRKHTLGDSSRLFPLQKCRPSPRVYQS